MAKSGQIIIPYGDPAETPASGKVSFYAKNNKRFYFKADDGVERPVTTSGTYLTPEEFTTSSGYLQNQIDAKAATFLELDDTPNAFPSEVKIVKVTSSGVIFDSHKIDHIIYVSKDSGAIVALGTTVDPFDTIQGAIDYAVNNVTLDADHRAAIVVYPGTYTEQIRPVKYMSIHGIDERSTIIQNTGADPSTYVLGNSANQGFKLYDLQLKVTTSSGIIHAFGGHSASSDYYEEFHNCRTYGRFAETDSSSVGCNVSFRNCFCVASPADYVLECSGSYNETLDIEFLFSDIAGSVLCDSSHSTGNGFLTVARGTRMRSGQITTGGDWGFRGENSQLTAGSRLTLGGADQLCVVSSADVRDGVHLTAAPSTFIFHSNIFSSNVPEGEADVTSDVTISGAQYDNNTQYRGIGSNIITLNREKKVYPYTQDSYITIGAALEAADAGDYVLIPPGTFEGNFLVDKNLTIQGAGIIDTYITSSSGVTFKAAGPVDTIIKDMSIKTTPTTSGCEAIRINGSATSYLDNVSAAVETDGYYANAIKVVDGGICRADALIVIYTNTGTSPGDPDSHLNHNVIEVHDGEFRVRNSTLAVYTSVATSDHYHAINNYQASNTVEVSASNFTARVLNPGFSGHISFMHNMADSNDIDSRTNNIRLYGMGGGYASAYSAHDGSTIHSSGNRAQIIGFGKNYFGETYNTGHLVSHFDDTVAADGVLGSGDYDYVNSPRDGDLEFSGSLRGVYGKLLTVSERGGDYSDIQEAINQVGTIASGTDSKYAIQIQPGVYTISGTIDVNNANVAALMGVNQEAVRLVPSASFAAEIAAGEKFLKVPNTTTILGINIDATDYPYLETAASGIAVSIEDTSYEEILLKDLWIRGFRYGLHCEVEANIYMLHGDIRRCGTGVRLNGDYQLFDTDVLFVEDCWDKHLHVSKGEAYFAAAEFCSTNTSSGTGIYVEGDDTYVELFGGTNIWGVTKNVEIRDTSTLRIDNCVLEQSVTNPGIDQYDDSTLIIVNSRAPLAFNEISVANPDNVYINAYNSTTSGTLMGTASDTDQTIFRVATGKEEDPSLIYQAAHDVDYKALGFRNLNLNENSEFFIRANNGNARIGIHPTGTDAWNDLATVGLASIQSGVRRGWTLQKEAGSSPELTIKTKSDILGAKWDYSGNFYLNTGVSVNKILDQDDLSGNDASALATQQSIKAYIDDNHYTSTELDNGQLDDRYVTLAHALTSSGVIDEKFVWRDGSRELTADWDVGNYEITAAGFKKDNTKVDLASYANITGILTGGELSINADPTKLDVASGTSIYVDMTDRDNPYVETVSWDSTTVNSTLSGIRSKWVGVYRSAPNTGTIVTDTSFTQLEKRTIGVLGRYWGSGTDTITGKGQYTIGAFGFGKSLEDLSYAIGSKNISGNEISAGTETLRLNRSAGQALRFSAGYGNSSTSPNIIDSTDQENISIYQYHIQGLNYTTITSGIDPDYWDNNGVKTAVPVGHWTAQRVYYFPGSSNVHVGYDQDTHVSKSLAEDGIHEDLPVLNQDILEGSILLAYLILKQGCTDLTDPNQAKIVRAIDGIEGLIPGNTNHGQLGGLLDDDHTQYHNDFRGDTRYYTKDQVDDKLATISGIEATISGLTHSNLLGLQADDHQHYSLSDGTRDYSGIVGYDNHKAFATDTDIIDKKYVDDLVITDHGGLAGLADDDHTIYIKADGTRNFSAKVSYSSHPTFTTDVEIVDKKYVDDSVAPFTTDHGSLGGLGDDDHTQYFNITRGDARYYTQGQVGTLFTNHYSPSSTDHDNRYYTETEVDNLVTTTSGVLQTQIDAIDVPIYYTESEALSSTTSTTYQTKATLTFGSGVIGTFRIGYSIEYQAQNVNKDVYVRFYNSTDASVIAEVNQDTTSVINWFPFSGFKHVSFTGTNKTFVLQYRAGTANCAVRRARIEAWRVS